MVNLIVLDTNIYRQLGLKFDEHIDYVNLKKYCYSSGSQIYVSKVVLEELLDFYDKEVINKSVKSIKDGIEKLKSIGKYDLADFEISEDEKKELLNSIKEKIEDNITYKISNELLNESDLIEFLIENKQSTKKDNTRDFLLFLSVVKIAEKYFHEQVIFITNDNIFESNDYFKEYLKIRIISNLKYYKSIAAFLEDYSQKVEFLTTEMLLSFITKEYLENILLEDIDSLPSHISYFYSQVRRKFKYEEINIKDIRVVNHYTYKEIKTEKFKVLFHVVASIKIVFEPERNLDELKSYLRLKSNENYYSETFDEKYRPIYNQDILFTFTARIDNKNKKINDLEFIDFYPDYYHYPEIYNP